MFFFFTFSTLFFAFFALFLLPLVQDRRSLRSLLQFGHEVFHVVKTVIEDPLWKNRTRVVQMRRGGWNKYAEIMMRRRTTSLSARRKETSGPPLTPFAVVRRRRGFSASIFIHDPLTFEFGFPAPVSPETPLPFTNTQSHLCAPLNTYHRVSLLSFPSS